MSQATLTSKGQMTIPSSIRKQLDLHAGDRLICSVEGDQIVLRQAKTSIRDLKGCLPKPKKALSLEEISAGMRKAMSRNLPPKR